MTSRTLAHVSQRLRTASTLRRKSRLHHGGYRPGIVAATLLQGSGEIPPAVAGAVLVQLELALDRLDLDAEADDLRQQPLLVSRAVTRPGSPRVRHGWFAGGSWRRHPDRITTA
jgi:hypothetical protein